MNLLDLRQSTFIRFLLVGGFFAAVYSVVTALLVHWTTWPTALLSTLVYLACIPPAYWTQRRFTFRPTSSRRGTGILYLLTQGLSLLIVTGLSALLTTQSLVWNTCAYLFASAVAAVVTYLVNRHIVFRA
jgi:putative flippase GtrA